MKLSNIFLFIAALFIFSACSETPAEKAHDKNEENISSDQLESDAEFLVNYKHDLMVSKKMAEIAVSKSVDQRIKQFANTVIKDIALLDAKLEKATSMANIVLPKSISEDSMEDLEDFREMDSEDFDEAYLEWFEEHNERFLEGSKDVIADTKHTKSLLDVANAISTQAFAHKTLIDQIKNETLDS